MPLVIPYGHDAWMMASLHTYDQLSHTPCSIFCGTIAIFIVSQWLGGVDSLVPIFPLCSSWRLFVLGARVNYVLKLKGLRPLFPVGEEIWEWRDLAGERLLMSPYMGLPTPHRFMLPPPPSPVAFFRQRKEEALEAFRRANPQPHEIPGYYINLLLTPSQSRENMSVQSEADSDPFVDW